MQVLGRKAEETGGVSYTALESSHIPNWPFRQVEAWLA